MNFYSETQDTIPLLSTDDTGNGEPKFDGEQVDGPKIGNLTIYQSEDGLLGLGGKEIGLPNIGPDLPKTISQITDPGGGDTGSQHDNKNTNKNTVNNDDFGLDLKSIANSLINSEPAESVGPQSFIKPAADPPPPIALAGKLLVEFTYINGAEKLNVLIVRAGDLPEKERGGSSQIAVHLTILPLKKPRFRTKVRYCMQT